MAWYVSAFLAAVAVCAAIYALAAVGRRLLPKRTARAVVRKRFTEVFPMTVGFVRRDRKERKLEFELEGGARVTLSVGEALYECCPMGTKGVLTWQGGHLLAFAVQTENGRETERSER